MKRALWVALVMFVFVSLAFGAETTKEVGDRSKVFVVVEGRSSGALAAKFLEGMLGGSSGCGQLHGLTTVLGKDSKTSQKDASASGAGALLHVTVTRYTMINPRTEYAEITASYVTYVHGGVGWMRSSGGTITLKGFDKVSLTLQSPLASELAGRLAVILIRELFPYKVTALKSVKDENTLEMTFKNASSTAISRVMLTIPSPDGGEERAESTEGVGPGEEKKLTFRIKSRATAAWKQAVVSRVEFVNPEEEALKREMDEEGRVP